jgi:hypothetical protein
MSKIYFMFFILFCGFSCFSQVGSDTIFWSDDCKLNWDDFRGDPSHYGEYSRFGAISKTEINAQAFWDNSLPNFTVEVYFLRSQSWVRTIKTDSVLLHEQIHFDISELYGRKIRKKVELMRSKNVESMDQYVNMIEELIAEWSQTQAEYDKATNHGLILSEQIVWIRKIRQTLEDYKKYISD